VRNTDFSEKFEEVRERFPNPAQGWTVNLGAAVLQLPIAPLDTSHAESLEADRGRARRREPTIARVPARGEKRSAMAPA
jgi:hypothetical protein